MIVLQTDSGGRGEYPKARERTLVKELGKLTPQLREKVCHWRLADLLCEAVGGRSEMAVVTVY